MSEWMKMDSAGQVSGLSCWTCRLLLFSFSLKTKSTHRNMKILKCTLPLTTLNLFFFLRKNLFPLRFDSLIGVGWSLKVVAFGTIWVSVAAVPPPSPWSPCQGQVERSEVAAERGLLWPRFLWRESRTDAAFSKHHFWLSPWHLVCLTLRGLRLTDFLKTVLKIRQNYKDT